MRNKYLRLLLFVFLICFLISCQLFSKTKTPTPVYVVVTNQEPTNTSTPTLTPEPTIQTVATVPFFDDFSSPQYGWPTGVFTSEYDKTDYQFSAGVYQWTVYSYKNTIEYAWPDLTPVGDFTVTVDARLKSNNFDDCDYGVLYRQPDGEVYLSFAVKNKDFSVMSYSKKDHWNEIISWTHNNAIAPGEFNFIKITAVNGKYTFYINDQKLTSFTSSLIKEGVPGLNVDVYPVDTTCVYEFDNFEVTSP